MKKLWITYGAIATALIAVWVLFLLLPMMREKTKLEANLASAESTVAQLQTEASNLPNIMKASDNLSTVLPDHGDAEHMREEVLTLLNRLGQQCESHSLAIAEVRPPVEELIELHERHREHPGMPQFLNVTLVLDGRYANFGQFVSELEHSDYFNRVNYVRAQSEPDNKHSTQFMIEFRVLLGVTPEVAG